MNTKASHPLTHHLILTHHTIAHHILMAYHPILTHHTIAHHILMALIKEKFFAYTLAEPPTNSLQAANRPYKTDCYKRTTYNSLF